jgi:hypothetical protein
MAQSRCSFRNSRRHPDVLVSVNYLSHHAVARRAATPAASSWFFMGNLLPDWLGASGAARVRNGMTAALSAEDAAAADLLAGVRLHLATDARFHAHPHFKEATEAATGLLRDAPFAAPPPRLFFHGHVAVEIALDGRTLTRQPDLADNLYAHLDTCGVESLARAAQRLFSLSSPATEAFTTYLHGFREARYLTEYLRPEGQAEALHRVSRRAGLPGFPEPEDRATLAATLAQLSPILAVREADLLTPPDL